MAVKAASGRVAEFYGWRVAAGARYCLVGGPEFKIREGMIERLPVQLDDVGVPSLVIGVTMGALILCGARLAPMKSLARRTIRCDFLMACKAEPHLRFARERLVTIAALLLELGMPVDDLPRHDKLLE